MKGSSVKLFNSRDLFLKQIIRIKCVWESPAAWVQLYVVLAKLAAVSSAAVAVNLESMERTLRVLVTCSSRFSGWECH